jgi:pantoate--beta-alanine ligase
VLTAATVAEVRAVVGTARAAGKRVAFVPTMGALHEGHLNLVDRARRQAGFVVASVFVNPLQFGPTEDFSRYPRDPSGDSAKLAARGLDVHFLPETSEVYPVEQTITVQPCDLALEWEGAVRPGHFAGVLTVVAKLLNIVMPDLAVFGQKDLQQVSLIQAMVRQLNMPIDIAVAETVREKDGLAMSSRNAYLSAEERGRASAIHRALSEARAAFSRNVRNATDLERCGREVLEREGALTIDYLAVVDPTSFRRVEIAYPGNAVIVAVRIGKTRLIDNILL